MKRVRRLTYKNGKGFTLIELILVIAILGILSSIALPRVGNIMQRAKEVADQANIRILQEAIERYMAESGDEDLSKINSFNGTTDEKNAKIVIEILKDGINGFGPYLKKTFDESPQQKGKNYIFDDETLEFGVQ